MRTTVTTTDECEAKRLVHAGDLCSALYDFEMILREHHRQVSLHGMSADTLIDILYEKWFDNLADNDIQLNQLW